MTSKYPKLVKEFVIEGIAGNGFREHAPKPGVYQNIDVRGYLRGLEQDVGMPQTPKFPPSRMIVDYESFFGTDRMDGMPTVLVVTLAPFVYPRKEREDRNPDYPLRLSKEDALLLGLYNVEGTCINHEYWGGDESRGAGPVSWNNKVGLLVAQFESAEPHIHTSMKRGGLRAPYYDLTVLVTPKEYKKLQSLPHNALMKIAVEPKSDLVTGEYESVA